VASHASGFAGNALHGAAVTEKGVGVVVDQVVAGLVENGSGVGLGDGQTDGVGETLAQRARGDLDTGSVVGLGVAGGDAAELLCLSAKSRFS